MVKKLATLGQTQAKKFLDEVKREIMKEEETAFKDFIKGAYRYSEELKSEMEDLQEKVDEINNSIEKASNGEWEDLSKVQIPAKYFSDETLRKHGRFDGGDNIKFTDLYNKKKK